MFSSGSILKLCCFPLSPACACTEGSWNLSIHCQCKWSINLAQESHCNQLTVSLVFTGVFRNLFLFWISWILHKVGNVLLSPSISLRTTSNITGRPSHSFIMLARLDYSTCKQTYSAGLMSYKPPAWMLFAYQAWACGILILSRIKTIVV